MISHIHISVARFVKLNSFILIVFSNFLIEVCCLCRTFCNNIPIKYPFGIDYGCGAAQFRRMCSILQPHHDFVVTDIQSAMIPPSPDTVFVLMNCSLDSYVLKHHRSLCFNFSGHTCNVLSGGCTSFKLFHLLSIGTPPCCFTTNGAIKYMSMYILDCSHYTSVYSAAGSGSINGGMSYIEHLLHYLEHLFC